MAIRQRVKYGVFLIHVNSTHNRIKKWLDVTFWGITTKYFQNHLNRFRIKEHLKDCRDMFRDFVSPDYGELDCQGKVP